MPLSIIVASAAPAKGVLPPAAIVAVKEKVSAPSNVVSCSLLIWTRTATVPVPLPSVPATNGVELALYVVQVPPASVENSITKLDVVAWVVPLPATARVSAEPAVAVTENMA